MIECPVPGHEHTLTLEGYHMQTISRVGNDRSKIHYNVLDPEGAKALQNQVMVDAYGFADESMPGGGEAVQIPPSIWRTLIADRNLQGQRPDIDPKAEDFKFDKPLFSASILAISGRKLFATHEGDLGSGPYEVSPGDLVCLFPGAQVPLVLRQKLHPFGIGPVHITQRTPSHDPACGSLQARLSRELCW